MDNGASNFRLWLRTAAGLADFPVATIEPPQAIALLACYLDFLRHTHKNSKDEPVAAKTLVGHLNAAYAYLQLTTQRTLPINYSASGKSKLVPLLGDQISFCQNWQQPQERPQPLNLDHLLDLL